MATAPELLKTSPEVVIRPMRAADVAEVVDIERSSYQFPWSEGIFRDCLRVGYVCRVVTLSRALLGYGVMSVGAGEAHILNLCVSEAFRCRGVGKRLLGSLIERAAAAGMAAAFLEVRPSNTAAIRLYLSMGFEQVGSRRGYYHAVSCREDAAVLSARMVIDCGKGVEERTIKLMEVCRLRDTPIMTFINKLDRDGRPPIELLDEIERVLRINTAPLTWPIGMGRELRGIYHLSEDRIYVYAAGERGRVGENRTIDGLGSGAARDFLGDQGRSFDEEIALVKGASHGFDAHAYLAGRQTPVFFGSAINNFGVEELLTAFTRHAPGPLPRSARERSVAPGEAALAGFVFKIQANMDPAHRDRIAFLRLCAGKYARGMRLYHVRLGKEVRVADALTFMAAERAQAEEAYAGDIIGLHNHGTINIGDTFTQGERLGFTGVPDFAPEIFRRAVLRDPMKMKALQRGLSQLCEEGATQLFKPLRSKDLILGAVGPLQFEVVAFRLQDEYGVQCVFDPVTIHTARWVDGAQARKLQEFRSRPH